MARASAQVRAGGFGGRRAGCEQHYVQLSAMGKQKAGSKMMNPMNADKPSELAKLERGLTGLSRDQTDVRGGAMSKPKKGKKSSSAGYVNSNRSESRGFERTHNLAIDRHASGRGTPTPA